MAMLAEPRRKQKVINLRAKNSAWSNDANKFGQRMLEKMGWSSGKGLGANENGIVEHVVARYKNDEKGLGFEDKNDQWTKHESDFNALLANLSNGDNNEEKLHSGVSLEVKSKKSKARVHYHKFTRGKDLTRYSEKDLANIFGKKTLKNKDEVEKTLKEDVKTSEHIFTEKGSMEDYFKNKLASMKSKSKIVLRSDNQNEEEEEADYSFRGFSGTANDEPDNPDNSCGLGEGTSVNNIEQTLSDCDVLNKKSKKKKKSNTPPAVLEENSQGNKCLYSNNDSLNDDSLNPKGQNNHILTKKKKKNTENTELIKSGLGVVCHENIADTYEQPIKKSKKKKYQEQQILEVAENDNQCIGDYVPKKKKKRKNKDFES